MTRRKDEYNTMYIPQKAQMCEKNTIAFYLTTILTELVFLKISNFNLILCFLLSICLVYLYVIKQEKVLVLCILIFANDALGQLFYAISVKYLTVLFLIYEIFVIGNIQIRKKKV